MTKEYYESVIGIENLARWEAMAASKNMTGMQLAELMTAKAVQAFDDIDSDPDQELPDPASSAGKNVIHVNFKAASHRKGRPAYRNTGRRLESRVGLLKITVPSTSPSTTSSAVSSTSPDTAIPYSSC